MARDYRKLQVFKWADDLVVDVYPVTNDLPMEERFGLKSQIRRAAVSVPANLVEGSARNTTRDYAHFVSVALGSANETRYLLELSVRLGYLDTIQVAPLVQRYSQLIGSLANLIAALKKSP